MSNESENFPRKSCRNGAASEGKFGTIYHSFVEVKNFDLFMMRSTSQLSEMNGPARVVAGAIFSPSPSMTQVIIIFQPKKNVVHPELLHCAEVGQEMEDT